MATHMTPREGLWTIKFEIVRVKKMSTFLNFENARLKTKKSAKVLVSENREKMGI